MRRSPGRPGGWRVIGRVLDGPAGCSSTGWSGADTRAGKHSTVVKVAP
ncbi:hypothetical protein I553_7222 [Mycobacterium xenopi 4042]|uniref:Uncharacterized protein n=1 Tax=Mycobacterium xenopi 4042 TaxID=1299334 RepID=X7Z624_MYCXE|nr:hypothetical protein I553_7222 [Mycobacterium xenopi 4042]